MSAPFYFVYLFVAIGGMRLAFERVDGNWVFSSESDPYAKRTYAANYEVLPVLDDHRGAVRSFCRTRQDSSPMTIAERT